ncbi:MAG: hypothetical protein KGN76_11075 [Acidobacteriota bacterium]|nr:hypothetical protein [Acidobacteriota bacterium]
MKFRTTVVAALTAVVAASAFVLTGRAQRPAASYQHLNPVIRLLQQKQPVFGVYRPSPRPFRRPGTPPPTTPPKSPAELATETLGYHLNDFLFDGGPEEGVDEALPGIREYVSALIAADASAKTPFFGLVHPLILKTSNIARAGDAAGRNISRELNLGASGIMFVEAGSAAEVRKGIAAMRFRSHGGTRPDAVGMAPKYWGMSEAEYRQKADLWPLNPEGELINWTIVETPEGLAHVKEIAAVKGIGVLWPGAGTLRQLYTTTDASGKRTFDQEKWEAAIQKVLAACKEFHVPCGYPANAGDIEMRMQQGFSVFVMPWGEQGFKAVEIGRKAAGR